MNFLQSLSSAVISASTAALSGSGGIPTLPQYSLGDKVTPFEGKSIWTLYQGIKKVAPFPPRRTHYDSTTTARHSN